MGEDYSSLRVFDAPALASGDSPNPSTSSAAGADDRAELLKALRYIAGMEAYGGDVHGLRDALADAKVTAERAVAKAEAGR
jgi:hypothetical protein